MKNYTPPIISLNGNSKKDLESQILNIYKSFTPLFDAISQTEYHNGRNAIDRNHQQQMRSEINETIEALREMQGRFVTLLQEIENN